MKNEKLENRRQSDSYKESMFIQHYDREQMIEFAIVFFIEQMGRHLKLETLTPILRIFPFISAILGLNTQNTCEIVKFILY